MNLTFEEAANGYYKFINLKLKQSSYRNVKNRIKNHILPFFNKKNIYDLTMFDFMSWQEYINNKNLKFKYKSTLFTCFVTFLNFCMKFYDLKENVASKVGNFKNNEVDEIGNIWSIEEYKQFISCVDNKIYRTLFDFLFFSGCRMGEVLALTFNDIDNNIISINKTTTRFFKDNKRITTLPKTKKSIRKISIDNLLKNEILDLRDYYITKFSDFNNNFYIFGGNKSIPPTTLTRKKDYYCDISGVKRIKIHEFRHSHACLLFKNNVPIDEISSRLGHSKLSVTMDIYLRYMPTNEKRVLDTLNSLRRIT